jgi:hypothetical protein
VYYVPLKGGDTVHTVKDKFLQCEDIVKTQYHTVKNGEIYDENENRALPQL